MSISASNDTLMNQAPATANVYLQQAIGNIEQQFGVGAAEKYPEIVAAMINASAMDYGASIIAKAIGLHSSN